MRVGIEPDWDSRHGVGGVLAQPGRLCAAGINTGLRRALRHADRLLPMSNITMAQRLSRSIAFWILAGGSMTVPSEPTD